MSEYTPTTALVRDSYAPHRAVFLRGKSWYPDREASEEEAAAEFDRWLVEHDRVVAERAWDEAIRHQQKYVGVGNRSPHNPYRKEQENGDPR